jgi:hypothetical protein
MPITREEKIMSYAIKDPRIPMATVEGFYDGERAVFICMVDQNPKTDEVDITPVAMLVREEDIKKITRPESNEPKIIISNGEG